MTGATRRSMGLALLLFGSGLCALVYQVIWFRLFRQSFGASTAASAAVLAVFMGGLGMGGALLGRRADRTASPLRLYAGLEVGIALAAALSPWLADLAQAGYIAAGGTPALGEGPGTVVRLLLAALVLGPPAVLMGGTLPAAARALERPDDRGRRSVALLYGTNTLGAVTGALLATFVTLEHLGIRQSLWAAAALNLLLAGAAFLWARRQPAAPMVARSKKKRDKKKDDERSEGGQSGESLPSRSRLITVLTAAALVGFVFFLMELVWYRMLAPLLGGSSYTFGLVLAVALAGVGAGGLLYAVGRRDRRPTLFAFAVTCALEAVVLALPFALGDRLAMLALLLRPVGGVGFGLLVSSWAVVTTVVVLPAAVVAGYQFPLLVAVLGEGRKRIGREVGWTYAANTFGAIAGSLAGGFGLLPVLTAPGVWKLGVGLLAALAVLTLVLAMRSRTDPAERLGPDSRPRLGRLGAPVATAVLSAGALALLATPGPTAFWRHSPIGAGGMPARVGGPNEIQEIRHATRRAILWQQEGRESSVAIHSLSEISFVLNGKSDGTALRDAPTQVMSGLIGAALHPDPRRALVIGLGSGSSAGWLAEVPGMERVDVVELEPAILHVAELCAPVNHAVLDHPKVHVLIGDGREHLLTSRDRYDLIFSEPSNPYRAGISSLFTVELYRAAADRLAEGGLFLQWLQGYQVDAEVVRTAYATLAEVFPHVESWQVHSQDLLLVAGLRPPPHDLDRVRERTGREPWKSALRDVLGVTGAEGLYTGYLATPAFARAVARQVPARNTDDHPVMEFGFVRNLGRTGVFDIERLRALARARSEGWPPSRDGLDLWRIEEQRLARDVAWGGGPAFPPSGREDFDRRAAARRAYSQGDLARALDLWQSQPEEASIPIDRVMLAEALADTLAETATDSSSGDVEARAQELAPHAPVTALAVRARLRARLGDVAGSADLLARAFETAREHPWVHRPLLGRALDLAVQVTAQSAQAGDRTPGRRLFDALEEPFSVRLLDEDRRRARLEIARWTAFEDLCAEALSAFEPHVPWEERFLRLRRDCYRAAGDPRTETAETELGRFLDGAPPDLLPLDSSQSVKNPNRRSSLP